MENEILKKNIENVQTQIKLKNNYFESGTPYFATTTNNKNVLTEYDHFPFTRYWKGVPLSDYNFVDGREAGWRNRRDDCYKYCTLARPVEKPDLCYQYIYYQPPCKPSPNEINGGNCIVNFR